MKTALCSVSPSRGLILLLCALVQPALAERLEAMNGLEGTFEFACDAPWRIEPKKQANEPAQYGAIPIQISIHDAMHTRLDDVLYAELLFQKYRIHLPPSLVSLGKFQGVRIRELAPVERPARTYDLNSLHEIEMTTGDWLWPANPDGHTHRLCRRWLGEDPEPFRNVAGSSEWHASLWYVPSSPAPGTTITLEIEVVLRRDPWPRPAIVLPELEQALQTSPYITLRNYVRVYFAPDPLPRFDNQWLYGDLHYHAQATDNEGEAAYNYRGVVRAMGAMGLDFIFATEHASSSPQIIDADLPPYYLIPEIVHSHGDKVRESDVQLDFRALRDMDAARYAFSHGLIYSDQGANREASLQGANRGWPQNYLSYAVVPQLFLGGEVDAIPELKISTVNRYNQPASSEVRFPYGNNLWFELSSLCSPNECDSVRSQLLEPAGDSYLVHDFQGVDSFQYYGREHLVYFPNRSALLIGRDSTFVPSYTSRYGGATRRLANDLLPEFERKGVAFVAHHLNGSSGSPGPNGVPWTLDHMLMQAFKSPAILGLEFWNEDTRYSSRLCSHDFCRNNGDGSTYLGEELGFERHEKLTADSNNPFEDLIILLANVLGGDLLPKEYHNLALPLEEVRRGFISGGNLGGLFALRPFAVPSGLWQEHSFDTEHMLYHGSHDWDMLNLRGLAFEANGDLTWLPSGEPRRVFMGGGSDAHGDFNYRRAGYFLGADDANDTAMGKPRNLVFAGPPEGPIIAADLPPVPPIEVGSAGEGAGAELATRKTPDSLAVVKPPPPVQPPVAGKPIRPHTQEQIIRALRSGRFSVTDGPALRIAIDMNGDHRIDDGDIQMGEVYRFKKLPPTRDGGPGQRLTLLTECVSTPEFGPINKIDIYVGVHPGSVIRGEARAYAPFSHGTRDPIRDADGNGISEGYVSDGRQYSHLKDGYWLGPNIGHDLTQRPPGPDQYVFTAVTTLDLDWYEAGQGISADRFFVRAFASTFGDVRIQKPARYAYSNPIWLLRSQGLFTTPTASTGSQADPPAPRESVSETGPKAKVARDDQGHIVISFNGTLQFTPRLGEPFQDLPEARNPFVVVPKADSGFYRARP